ncbi:MULTISPECIES: Crp/Fnr family transcriptional regulator [Stutzerimonas]|jgi:CRP-like cAMP-binding protein|uniref:DnrE protein n=2 Tax=Stutzerimonas balearica TaxID=74829 RepID=A0A8D3XZ67_9GAMM|nr:Crp/Fnr family transcriptional regulator [Stutzerimonas balearica]KIL02438.1 DnrE protein [Stutzerimonas stutzeri]MBB61918.1 Crp/Fnr family transcriptional regulator [Pseudomonas sp.]MBZ5755193.1 Crp/Fnr family transcriptional regulator [Pseudomonas sp. S5(2021)]WIX03644.1 Crp/Fnr family transcriptional regulator [Pseudomonas sp. AR5]AJE14299.1 DnrE protein [Stutzerimonas balearica DSM 6083]
MLTEMSLITALRSHHLFSRLPDAAMQEVCALANLKRLPAGATLFHQGDKADRFYYLFSGQVKLHRVVCDGQEKLVEVMRAGDSFAEALLFRGTPYYPVSATALKASLAVSLNGPHYRRILEEQPGICLEILATLSVRLHQRMVEIDTLTMANASRRVVRFLLQSAGERDGVVTLDVPKRLVASKLGIQPETFSRILHRLVEAGTISVERRRIEILDANTLAAHDE